MKPANKFFQLFINARLATLLCCSLLVSCGGSETTAGIGGTGISYGAVSGFGSIIVNGSDIDFATATVTLDGNPGTGTNSGLKIGMVVKVSGSFDGNTGMATSVEYRDNLEGEVCDAPLSIDGIRTLRVLGQKVILDATTIVDSPATIDSISLGDIVEVSGLPDKDGKIHASFIEVKDLIDAVIEVKGRVVGVSGFTLTINQLVVDFSSALIDDSIPNNTPAAGQFVEVKGPASCNSPNNQTDTLTATSIELESEGAGDISTSDHAEVEGLVTVAFVELSSPGGPGTFNIGNRQIQTTNSTRFLPEGFDSSDLLILGTKVEAEGTSANGVLTATKISFRENVKLDSDVDAATISGIFPTFSFELVGLPGIIITTNLATTGVAPAGHIRVRGIEGPDNTVLATQIDDRSGQADAFLQGPVDDISGANVTILGVTVDTSSIFQFEDVDDLPISSATTFLGLVQPGTLVKFKGVLMPSNIIWDEAELEDD